MVDRTENEALVKAEDMERFMRDVFISVGVPKDHAEICSDVLISSDIRGIESHGCARLYMYYIRIKRGQQDPQTRITIEKEKLGTAYINAHNGMGQVAAKKAMELAINKARQTGISIVTVGQSNHFGIAGYYANMATEKGMIGICGTNARPAITPTWGVEPMLGTNPLTIGIPTDWEFPWIADHATSIIQRGKVEIAARLNKPLKSGLIINEKGDSSTDAQKILKDMMKGNASLLPLGGYGEEYGGYKGYNYATFVEMMSATLSHANYLRATSGINKEGKPVAYNLGHFFIAIDISAFMDLNEYKKVSGDLLRELVSAKKDPNADHIYVAGEKEFYAMKQRCQNGFPISEETQKQLVEIANNEGLKLQDYNFHFNVKMDSKVDTGW